MNLKGKANKSMKIKNINKIKDDDKYENIALKYLKCYKEIFLRKQILLFIICLVIFLVAFTIGMSTIDFNAPLRKDINELANISLIQTQFIFVMILTPFLALIPFIKKISIVTVFYSYFLAFNVANMFYLPTCNKILLSISVVLSLLALSLNLVLSFELSEKVYKKFTNVLNKKNGKEKSDKKTNIDDVFEKEEKYSKLKKNVIIVIFIMCMILSIVNLIVTKFI